MCKTNEEWLCSLYFLLYSQANLLSGCSMLLLRGSTCPYVPIVILLPGQTDVVFHSWAKKDLPKVGDFYGDKHLGSFSQLKYKFALVFFSQCRQKNLLDNVLPTVTLSPSCMPFMNVCLWLPLLNTLYLSRCFSSRRAFLLSISGWHGVKRSELKYFLNCRLERWVKWVTALSVLGFTLFNLKLYIVHITLWSTPLSLH